MVSTSAELSFLSLVKKPMCPSLLLKLICAQHSKGSIYAPPRRFEIAEGVQAT